MTREVVNRERLSNDLLNTSVMAALVGGFALGTLLASPVPEEGPLRGEYDIWIYLLSFIAVHANTCSALTSAFLYRKANAMADEDIAAWATKYRFLLQLPMGKVSGRPRASSRLLAASSDRTTVCRLHNPPHSPPPPLTGWLTD